MRANSLQQKIYLSAIALVILAGSATFFFFSQSQSATTINLPHDLGGPHAISCQSASNCLVIGENYLAKGGFIGRATIGTNSISFTTLDRNLPVATSLSCYAPDHCLSSFVSNSPSHALAQFSPSSVAAKGVNYLQVPSQFQQVNAIFCLGNSSICLIAGKASGNYHFAFQLFSTATKSFIGEPIVKTLSDIGGIYDMACDRSQRCLTIMENFDGTAGIVYAFSLQGLSPSNLATLSFKAVATPPANLLLTISCSSASCLIGGSDASSIHGLLIKVNTADPSYPFQQITLPKSQGPILAVSSGNKPIIGGYPVYSNYGDLVGIS